MGAFGQFGGYTWRRVSDFGDFCRFCGQSLMWVVLGARRWRTLRRTGPQFYEVGSRSVPVIVITGAFIGAVLAVQSINQLKALGLESTLGPIISFSVLRELGPVLAGLMLAGRVGGGLTAELGTMKVTEQIDALRAMGADPLRVLVVPRFLACVLMIPLLVLYAAFVGILGGYVISVYVYGITGADFWRLSQQSVMILDVFYGPIKSVFFGAAISLVACYKGFRCAPGAAGVGRACTEAFVASCMTVLALNFFLGMLLNSISREIWGIRSVF